MLSKWEVDEYEMEAGKDYQSFPAAQYTNVPKAPLIRNSFIIFFKNSSFKTHFF